MLVRARRCSRSYIWAGAAGEQRAVTWEQRATGVRLTAANLSRVPLRWVAACPAEPQRIKPRLRVLGVPLLPRASEFSRSSLFICGLGRKQRRPSSNGAVGPWPKCLGAAGPRCSATPREKLRERAGSAPGITTSGPLLGLCQGFAKAAAWSLFPRDCHTRGSERVAS